MINLLRFKKNQKYLVADTETCSLNLLYNNYPWQLTYAIVENGKVQDMFDRFIFWENLPITKGAADVTHFNYQSYKSKAEDPAKVLDHFEKFLYNDSYMSVFHNGLNFDIYILNFYRKVMKKKIDYSYLPRFLDTNCLSKALLLNRKPENGESLIAFQYKMNSIIQKGLKTNVGAMCAHLGIEFDKNLAHDGKYDVLRTVDILQQLLYKLDI